MKESEDKAYGEALRVARKRAGFRTQEALGDVVGRSSRQVQNYEKGKYLTPEIRAQLERVLGKFYDGDSDPVVAAINRSQLDEWRRDDVRSTYRRHLHEQAREQGKEATG